MRKIHRIRRTMGQLAELSQVYEAAIDGVVDASPLS
jgi:hypothetical protein